MSEDGRPKFCPRCGHEAPAHGDFCPECGADILAEAEPATPGGENPHDSTGESATNEPEVAATASSGTPTYSPSEPTSEDESTVLTRRNALVGGGVLVAGGLGAWWLTGEGGPKYSDDITTGDLVPPVSVFPADWERNDEFNDNFDAVYLNSDQTITVTVEADRYESVDQAKRAYQSTKEGAADTNNMSFADEAFWTIRSDGIAFTAFRDSNAVGIVGAVREGSLEWVPDQSRSQQYAREMYRHWQSL